MINMINGDCFNYFEKFIKNGIKFNAIICDPPYNIHYDKWDKFDITKAIDYFDKLLLPNSNIVIFQGYSNVCETKQQLDKAGFLFQDWIIYDRIKGRGCKRHLVSTREDILWYSNSNNYTFNKIPSSIKKKTAGLGLKNGCEYRALSNVWTDISPIVPWSKERVAHSSQKPLQLMDRLVKLFTNEQDLILDFCAGTMTTGVACLRNGRNCWLIEKDPEIFKIGIDRVSQDTKDFKLYDWE